MGNPDPALSSKDIRQTFQIMGHSDEATVALIGAHALGKGHAACPKGPGPSPMEAYNATPPGIPWPGLCGTGKAQDTFTAGFEGPWTDNPTTWDNQYFQDMVDHEWEKHHGPGGHWQWRIKGSNSQKMRMTSDLALMEDEKYREYVKKFANDMDAFNEAFNSAWFDLTTRYGGGTWSKSAKCDQGELPHDILQKMAMLDNDMDFTSAVIV
jgi:catalase (peroxidase I)